MKNTLPPFRALLPLLACTALGACSDQVGVVGGERLDEEGYFTDFPSSEDAWETQLVVEGASVTFGLSEEAALDDQVVELRFPGHPEFESGDSVGPTYATQIATTRTFHFGTFRSRLRFGSCSQAEETVLAAFGYFRDGTDQNENGITDDLEINFQVVCGSPTFAYLTVFTDYETDAEGNVVFRKVGRVVNLETGELFDTPNADSNEFVPRGNDPDLVFPGAFEEGAYYDLGFEWHTDSLRFFLSADGNERTLFSLSDPERIPQQPVYMMYNLWHPGDHWYPATGEADYPANDVVLRVDWFRHTPE